jgi:predicted transcriptional regulator of viral defense system
MNGSKTLGPRTVLLFTGLHDEGRTLFDLDTAASLMKLDRAQTAGVLHAAVKRGLVTPVKRGLYNLVSFELGSTTFHLEDRYLLVQASMGEMPYFFSHASALDIHQLATQPNSNVYVTSTRRRKDANLGGSPIHFVSSPQSRFFGFTDQKMGKTTIVVSDLERTLLDSVSLPSYCGGFVEVAKAFFMAKGRLDSAKLLTYGRRFDKAVVLRRAGYLMELFQLADKQTLDALANELAPSASLLDPEFTAAGKVDTKWGLTLNVTRDELLHAVSH